MKPDGTTIFLGGDVMTGRGIDQVLPHPGDARLYEPWVDSALDYVELAERASGPLPRSVDPAYIWGDALELLAERSPAARIVNLETAVTDRGGPWPGKGIHYRMHPENVTCLEAAAITCCVLANNHVLDWSHDGLEQTLDTLESAGIAVAGAGRDSRAAAAPAVIGSEPGRRVVVIAVGAWSSGIPESWAAAVARPGVAFSRDLSRDDVVSIAARVASTAVVGDVVVVSIHWGSNWGYDIPKPHRRFARALIDEAGVDVVHGHSSHHPLGIEVYRDRPILYGCGDLINDYEGIRGNDEFHPSLHVLSFATMGAEGEGLQRLELVPVETHRFRLRVPSKEATNTIARVLDREGKRLGTRLITTSSGSLELAW